jgi:hypothetical protein
MDGPSKSHLVLALLWAYQEWSFSLYVHKHGRQLFVFSVHEDPISVPGLGLGSPGLQGLKMGDLVVRLDGSRQFCALRHQSDDTYTFRGAVTLEDGLYQTTGQWWGEAKPFKLR